MFDKTQDQLKLRKVPKGQKPAVESSLALPGLLLKQLKAHTTFGGELMGPSDREHEIKNGSPEIELLAAILSVSYGSNLNRINARD